MLAKPKINLARLKQLESEDPELYRETIADLEELDRLFESNPLAFFRPHPKQQVFLRAHTPVKAFLGGNRSGKTTAGIVDDLIQAVDRECLSEHLRPAKRWEPPFKCRIVTPDFTSTMEGVVFDKLRMLAPKPQLLGGSWEKAYDKQNRKLRFANGSWFDFMTFEQDLDKFGGAALHRVHYDEEPPEAIRKECRMRLIDYGGDEVLTMTPLLGMSWSFDQVYERRLEPEVTVVEVDMDENPHLNEEAKEMVLQGLTEEERKARKEGKYVHFAGLVFPEFTSDHVVPPVSKEHLKGQTVVVGIDPGIGFSGASFIGFDSENAAVVFDELFLKNQTVEGLCSAIKDRVAHWGLEPDYYVIDPSARNRTLTNAEQVEAEFARHGIYCVHGQNAVEPGVFQIKRRLQADPPSLVVAENCRECIHEFGRLRIKETPDGKFAILKEAGVNARNEVMDTVRYVLMSRPWYASPTDAPKRRGWQQGHAPPASWFEGRTQDVAPMGAYS